MEALMLDLPSYGYVLLTVVLTYFLLFWQGFMVGQKRKLYKVDYPAMYSDTEPMFNCYQVWLQAIINFRLIIDKFREFTRTPWSASPSSWPSSWPPGCLTLRWPRPSGSSGWWAV